MQGSAIGCLSSREREREREFGLVTQYNVHRGTMGKPQMSVSFDSIPSVGGDTAANCNQLRNIVHFLF